MNRIRIGVDVGGTNAEAVALAAGGRVVASARRATRIGPDGVVDTVRGLVAELADGRRELVSVGVGIPGIVADGTVRHAVNLDLRETDLAAALRGRLAVPVAIDNDVRAAALGAHATQGGSLAYLNLGTGIAAGIVTDGTVRRGASGAAGEIGHIPIDPVGPVCACGQRGCIEAFAGGAAIARRWHATEPALAGVVGAHAAARTPTDVSPALSAADRPLAIPPAALVVFDAADAGDERAIRIRDDAVHAIAAAARILVLATDVERVVLGGGVSRLGERLRGAVARELDRAAAASPFLTELRLADRIDREPAFSHVPAIGAALLPG